MSDGTFDGKVVGTKWTDYQPQGGIAIPVLCVHVELEAGGESHKVFPSLFMDNEIIERGIDAGKTRVKATLELLESYEVPVNVDDPTANDPLSWGEALLGQTVSVFVKKDTEGKVRAYLNKRGKAEIPADRVRSLWAAVAGAAPKSAAESVDVGLDDEDDLPWK